MKATDNGWPAGVWYAAPNSAYWDVMICTDKEADGPQGIGYPFNPSVASVHFSDKEMQEPTARLISAAPDMATTLKAVEKWIEANFLRDEYAPEGYAEMLNAIDDALSKAGGR